MMFFVGVHNNIMMCGLYHGWVYRVNKYYPVSGTFIYIRGTRPPDPVGTCLVSDRARSLALRKKQANKRTNKYIFYLPGTWYRLLMIIN